MAILVIGGAGYIGSHAVKALAEAGQDVVVLDNFRTGHKQAVHPDATLIEGDLRDGDLLQQVFVDHSIEAVMHFAAHSLVGESVEKPIDYFDNNVGGMISLIQAMKKANVDKLIFSSTAAVYGQADTGLIDEETSKAPTSPYGESKLMMEKMIQWCDQAYGIKYVSLRYFNVAGASSDATIGEDHHPETHLVPIILQVALGERDKLTIFGDDYDTPDGTCIRDYVQVEDLVHAHLLALDYLQQGNDSQAFNLGSAEGYSVKEMLEAARRVTSKEISAEIGPRRAGDPSKLVASSQKAREVLNWQPQYTDIEEIIQTAWKWHSSHPKGYQDEAQD